MELDRKTQQKGKVKNNQTIFIVVVILIAIILSVLLTLLKGETKIEALTLDKTNVSLSIDQSDRLTVTVKPEKAQPDLIWGSSDENVVKVMDGVVMACHPGKAVVKVSVKDQNDLFAVCEYSVKDPAVDVQTVDIIEDPVVLRPGGHQQLTIKMTPENPDETILWTSTNENVARVSSRGKIEALRVGYAFIIATSEQTGAADTTSVSVEGTGVKFNGAAPNPSKATVKSSNPDKRVIKTSTAKSYKSAPAKYSKRASTSVVKSSGTKSLGYAIYRGNWPNDVNGRMEFRTSHVIDSKDPKGRVAQPGDYVVGEWSGGHLVQGVWYGANHRAKGSILIGK